MVGKSVESSQPQSIDPALVCLACLSARLALAPFSINGTFLKSLHANREAIYLFPPSKKTLALYDKVKHNPSVHETGYRGDIRRAL